MTNPTAPNIPRVISTQKDKLELLKEEAKIEKAYQLQSARSFLCFIRGLKIDSVHGPRLFEGCMADFQRSVFEAIAPTLHELRRGILPKRRKWWIERTKKASKDADLATILLWLLAFPKRPLYIQVGAANKEQAAIVKERMVRLIHWNPWLKDRVTLVQWEGRSVEKMQNGDPMVKLHIMSSEIAGAHGGTPDLLVINELSHIVKWEFAENLMDNASGVAQGVVIIATNAGFRGSKAEKWRNSAVKENVWEVHALSRPAPWHSKEDIDEAERRNSRGRFLRLWKGVWVDARGDAMDERDIDACFVHSGPLKGPESGWDYVAGLDLGVSHDHSAAVVLGVNSREGRLRVARWVAYAPSASGEVNLIEVEKACLQLAKKFRVVRFFYDPHQCKLMAQRLQRQGVMMEEMSFSQPGNLTKMATSLIQIVSDRKLECYDDQHGRLRADFNKFNLAERPYGYKLEAVSDETGHADVGTALCICLPAAVEMMGGVNWFGTEDSLTDLDDRDFTKEEVKRLPTELKELFETESEDPTEYADRPTERDLFDVW